MISPNGLYVGQSYYNPLHSRDMGDGQKQHVTYELVSVDGKTVRLRHTYALTEDLDTFVTDWELKT